MCVCVFAQLRQPNHIKCLLCSDRHVPPPPSCNLMAVLLQQQMPAAPSYQQRQRTRHCYLVSNVPPYIIIDLVLWSC